jgi:outer membrane protein assembly factor BamB
LADSGVLYLVSQPRGGTTVLTAYRSDSSVLWQTPIGGSGWHPPAPVISANGTIYVFAPSFKEQPQLVAVAPDARELWRVTVPHRAGEDLILGEDGRIFVKVANGVVAFDEQGDKLWEFTAENQDVDGGIALAGDGTLYFASRFLYALDKMGKPKWNFKSELTCTKRDYFGHHPLIAKDGTFYANSYFDQLYAITPDGRKKWVVSGEPTNISRSWGQPVLTKEGNLMTTAGWFLLTKERGLAATGWPTANHDNSTSRRQDNP